MMHRPFVEEEGGDGVGIVAVVVVVVSLAAAPAPAAVRMVDDDVAVFGSTVFSMPTSSG